MALAAAKQMQITSTVLYDESASTRIVDNYTRIIYAGYITSLDNATIYAYKSQCQRIKCHTSATATNKLHQFLTASLARGNVKNSSFSILFRCVEIFPFTSTITCLFLNIFSI